MKDNRGFWVKFTIVCLGIMFNINTSSFVVLIFHRPAFYTHGDDRPADQHVDHPAYPDHDSRGID